MKILFVITGLTIGGAERQVCNLADKFYELGYQVKIVVLNDNIVIRPTYKKIDIISLRMNKTIVGFISAIIKIRKVIKDFNPDVIHSHMIHANIFSRVSRLFVRVPKLICTAHSSNEGGKISILAYRLTDKLSDITTNVSADAVDIYIKNKSAPKNKIITVSNGLNIDNFYYSDNNRAKKREVLGIGNDCYLYLAVGRLCDAKDYPNLLYALSLLSLKTDKKFFLAIIGEGDERNEIEKLILTLNLTEYVSLLGLQEDVEQWLSAADCYVLSSYYEGFGLAVAEAMLTERLVIATDCGGVKDVINGNGLLVPVSNSKLLADVMYKALNIPKKERDIIGKGARMSIIDNYSLSIVADKWISIYKKKYK